MSRKNPFEELVYQHFLATGLSSLAAADLLERVYEGFKLNRKRRAGILRRQAMLNQRQLTGSFYTRYDIAYKFANVALSDLFGVLTRSMIADLNKPLAKEKLLQSLKQLINLSVLDPAAGSGKFLVAIFQLLDDWYPKIKASLSRARLDNSEISNSFKVRFDGTEVDRHLWRKHILTRILNGIDLSDTPLRLASEWLIRESHLPLDLLASRSKLLPGFWTGDSVHSPVYTKALKSTSISDDLDKWLFTFADSFPHLFDPSQDRQGFDLIIGNPPWGIQYDRIPLTSSKICLKDSYAVFMVKAHELLAKRGKACLLTSGSWLTTKSYAQLRKYLLLEAGLVKIFVLPKRIFPESTLTSPPSVIVLEKNADSAQVEFTDMTEVSAITEHQEPTWILDRWSLGNGLGSRIPFSAETRYLLLPGEFSRTNCVLSDHAITTFLTKMGPRRMAFLGDLAEAIVTGIKTYNNRAFIKSVKGGRYEVPSNYEILLRKLAKRELSHGIRSDNPSYIPLAKGGSTLRPDGKPRQYWAQPDFYIRWDAEAVSEYKRRASLRNREWYFKKGVGFSAAGRFSPTFRIVEDCLFDSDFPVIFLKNGTEEYILGVLCSSVGQFICKQLLNHTDHFKLADARDLPIPIPTDEEFYRVTEIVSRIVSKLRQSETYDYSQDFKEIEKTVTEMYCLPIETCTKIAQWYVSRFSGFSTVLQRNSANLGKDSNGREYGSANRAFAATDPSTMVLREVDEIGDPTCSSARVLESVPPDAGLLTGACLWSKDGLVLLVDLRARLGSRWILLDGRDLSPDDIRGKVSEWERVFSETFWLRNIQRLLDLREVVEPSFEKLEEIIRERFHDLPRQRQSS